MRHIRDNQYPQVLHDVLKGLMIVFITTVSLCAVTGFVLSVIGRACH